MEKREKEESPMNWGHSYCSKRELLVAVLTCPPACEVIAATVETSSKAKIKVTCVLFCSEPFPQRGMLGYCFTINFTETPPKSIQQTKYLEKCALIKRK